jgi:hypothetical protein
VKFQAAIYSKLLAVPIVVANWWWNGAGKCILALVPSSL